MNNRLTLWFIIALTSAAYLLIAVPTCIQSATICFSGTDLAPVRYRILQPILEYSFSDGTRSGVLYADVWLQIALTIGTITGLYKWLCRWVSSERALFGVLLFAFVWVVSFNFYMRSLSTSIELCLLVWFLVLVEKSLIWQVVIVILASLNRETAALLPILWGMYHYKLVNWLHMNVLLLKMSVLALVYGSALVAIHLSLGSADHVLGLQGTFDYNLQNLPQGFLSVFLLHPIGIGVIMQYRASSPLFKRLAWVAGGYLAACLIGGSWSELLRLGLPAIVLVMPMLLQPIRERKRLIGEQYIGGGYVHRTDLVRIYGKDIPIRSHYRIGE